MGQVDFTDPDLPDRMAKLRENAQTLGQGRLATKIVVPNDHIRYLSLPPLSGSRTGQMQVVETALEGATPYPVSQLAYDWTSTHARGYVAAVARETLREAEQFAQSYGLAPVSYVATPEEGRFENDAGPTEPFFGTALSATDYLRSGEIIEPDTLPIKITGTAEIPRFTGDVPPSTPFHPQTSMPAQPEIAAEPLPEFKIPKAARSSLTQLEEDEFDPAAPPRIAGVPSSTNVVALPSDVSTLERAMAIAPVTGQRRTGLDGLDEAIASLTNREPVAPEPPPLADPDLPDPLEELRAYRDPDPDPKPDDLRRERGTSRWVVAGILSVLLVLALLFAALAIAPANAAEADLALGQTTVAPDAAVNTEPPRTPRPSDFALRPALRPGSEKAASVVVAEIAPQSIETAALTLQTVTDTRLKRRPSLRPGSAVQESRTLSDTPDVSEAVDEALVQTLATPSPSDALSSEDPEVAALTAPPDPRVVGKRAALRPGSLNSQSARTREEVETALVVAALSNVSRPALRPRTQAPQTQAPRVLAQATPKRDAAPAVAVALPASAAQRPKLRSTRAVQRSRDTNVTTATFKPLRTARPSGRTPAAAARNATEPRALKLGRVTLIGTMGTKNDKSALVRLNSGRIRNVSVGDRLDGGRVAAIDAKTLRYRKGNRTITLNMPRG
ncbi:MAG: hypothetical protein AAGD04_08955 [Pseudomonadota bacterium]